MSDRQGSEFEHDLPQRLRDELDRGLNPFAAHEVARLAMRAHRTRGRGAIVGATILLAGAATVAAFTWVGSTRPDVGAQRSQSPSPSPSLGSPASSADPPAILRVAPGENVQVGPAPEHLLQAFDVAMQLTVAHPSDLGYPWVDVATGELVLSSATARGRDLLDQAEDPDVPWRIRDVVTSYAELQRIQEGVTQLNSEGVAGADRIVAVAPDMRDNRVLVTLSEMSEPLLAELGRRYGPDAIAVRVDPGGLGAGTGASFRMTLHCAIPFEAGGVWWHFVGPVEWPLAQAGNSSDPYPVPGLVRIDADGTGVFRADVNGAELPIKLGASADGMGCV